MTDDNNGVWPIDMTRQQFEAARRAFATHLPGDSRLPSCASCGDTWPCASYLHAEEVLAEHGAIDRDPDAEC